MDQMVNIFIDTNVYLSFFHFTNDDLEELRKLGFLLSQKEVSLFMPSQTLEEFRRNRDNKIEDAMKKFKDQRLDFQFPQFCKDYPEFENLRELQKTYSKVHNKLAEKVLSDIQAKSLKADSTFEELTQLSIEIPIDDEMYEKARRRLEVGNPPGKKGSIGDALNWEALLTSVPDGENLCFISDDKDYASPLDQHVFNSFLAEEWFEKKRSNIKYYRSLSVFFREHYPDISLADEREKDKLIQELANSFNFAETHAIIGKLRKYSGFTIAQTNAIVDAAISNNQVSWIIQDGDVHDFIQSVIKGKEDQIDNSNLATLNEILNPDSEQEKFDKDFPF
ncbi:MAG: DUF4935 domain-containing protein [Anaerolineales bacterium]|nr:DUF4935 domain-containing protein [Anaerolineales bacterium]